MACASASPPARVFSIVVSPPVLEGVPQRLFEGDAHFPPRRGAESARIAEQHRDVGGPQPVRIRAHFDLRLRHAEEQVENLANGIRLSRTEIIDLARGPFL